MHPRGSPDCLIRSPLAVVEIYNKIWGPCEVLANNFLNLYYDLSDKLSLRFVRAEVDHLEEPSLAHFKGSAQANFLFYLVRVRSPLARCSRERRLAARLSQDGELIRDVKGPNLPQIKELINTKAPPLQA